MRKALILSIFLAVFSVSPTVYAMTFVTPSGVVVDDQGHLISAPIASITAPIVKIEHQCVWRWHDKCLRYD